MAGATAEIIQRPDHVSGVYAKRPATDPLVTLNDLARRFLVPVLLAGIAQLAWAATDPRPNFLWISCEDISPNLRCYGDPYAVTPNLDRLAEQGVRYMQAFAPIGVCAPARSCLITGMYPPSIGTHHMRCSGTLPDGVKPFSVYLRQAGYYCTNKSKEDYNFRKPPGTWDESGRQAHWRKRKPGQPFFAVFNLTVSHESAIRISEKDYRKRTAWFTDRERHDPALARIPPYHPDTPEVRKDWARYADMITCMDREAGRILDELKADGLNESTIVIFFSDHGAGMPRSKRWLYDSSLLVPLIIRVPEPFRRLAPGPSGTITDRLVSFVDFAPTMLSLAGIDIPEHMQGKAFLGDGAAAPRTHIYGFRDRMDERYDLQRAVRDRRYKYIRNYMPHRPYAQYLEYMYKMPTMQVWQRLYDQGALLGLQRRFFERKSPAELYDTWADPHEVHNLAGQPDYAGIEERLARRLREWMMRIGDLGFLPEADLRTRFGGRPEYDGVRSDPDAYPLSRLIDAAEHASLMDPQGLPALKSYLQDDDPAVRFWGVTGLSALDVKPARVVRMLRKLLADSSSTVALAAAEVLCTLGRHQETLPLLERSLAHENAWVRLQAGIILDDLGERARPLLPAIQEANRGKHRKAYDGRVFRRLLEKLTPSAGDSIPTGRSR